MSARTAHDRGLMLGRVIVLGLATALASGCDCELKRAGEDPALPDGFEEVMRDHAALSLVARNALIRGDLPVAQQSMRKLAFFMEHVPFPKEGKEYARITRELVNQVREAADLEEACMAFALLSNACGQCHHALDRGPPMKLEPTPEGQDLKMHMRRHAWAVERMWEALLSDSTSAFQAAAGILAESPLHGPASPDSERPAWHDSPRVRSPRLGVRRCGRGQGSGGRVRAKARRSRGGQTHHAGPSRDLWATLVGL